MKKIYLWAVLMLSTYAFAQQHNTLSLLFMGDIMGHDPQIKAAYDAHSQQYDYNSVFQQVSPIIRKHDFGIANLEVTLAGAPYQGYPNFSSPDALAQACKNNGIGVLVTANNHSCDKGKKGIVRTIKVLDSLQIAHTGTFADSQERERKNLLVLEKNNIRVGILNYTYGTNGIPIPAPTIVNTIDTLTIRADIQKAKEQSLDKLIAFVHWGDEYKQNPNGKQRDIADFLFRHGVHIIIGSHPHVLQPMEYLPSSENGEERMVVYSLGNFVSNQRKPNTDGGAMVRLVLEKTPTGTRISEKGYYLTWVHKYKDANKNKYEILPCAFLTEEQKDLISQENQQQMQSFITNSRSLFEQNNVDVLELRL